MAIGFTIGTDFEGLISRLSANAVPESGRASFEYVVRIVDSATSQWPVSSGASVAAFRVVQRFAGDKSESELINDVGYAPFINGGETTRRLIIEPFNAGADGLATAIGKSMLGD